MTNNNLENTPDVLTISELQQFLKVGRSTVYRLINSREIEHIRIGRSIRIPKQFVVNYIRKHENTIAK